MRVLMIGSGGVGDAAARIAAERGFFERWVVADYDVTRAQRTVAAVAGRHPGEARFVAAQVDASSAEAVMALAREHGATHVLNAVDPKFNMPIFTGAKAAGADYLDMAMSLSQRHPEQPYEKVGVMLGDDGNEVFAPSFSMWTTIEECLNPPVVWEKDRGWFTTAPFSEPEVFDFPEGIGPVECVNVEHEEVLLMPRWVDARRVTFKYGLGDEFITILKVLNTLGLDNAGKIRVGGVEASPRDVVAASLPDPATLGDRMRGKTCAGTWVKGVGKDGE